MLTSDYLRELLSFLGEDISCSLLLHDTASDELIHGALRDPRDDPVLLRDARKVRLTSDQLIKNDPSEFIRKNVPFVQTRTNSLI